MQGPHPAQAPVSPAHRFRPRKIAHDLGHDLGHHLRRCSPRSLDRRHIEVTLLVGADLRLVQRREPGGFEESLHRRLGRADARALLLFAHIGGARRQPVDYGRETPRRGEAPHRVKRQSGIFQLIANEALKILCGACLHARRDLLGEQLEQKLSHERPHADQAWAPPASVLSQAAQTARASSRTRRMKACRSVTEITPRASSRLKICEALIAWS
jgi:hypothetical protein